MHVAGGRLCCCGCGCINALAAMRYCHGCCRQVDAAVVVAGCGRAWTWLRLGHLRLSGPMLGLSTQVQATRQQPREIAWAPAAARTARASQAKNRLTAHLCSAHKAGAQQAQHRAQAAVSSGARGHSECTHSVLGCANCKSAKYGWSCLEGHLAWARLQAASDMNEDAFGHFPGASRKWNPPTAGCCPWSWL